MAQKPECPGLVEGMEARPSGGKPAGRPVAMYAKQSQFPDGALQGSSGRARTLTLQRETKPIARRQEAGGTESDDGACKTNPNLGGMGHLAKNEHHVQGGFAAEWIMRNKANLSCRTGGGQSPPYTTRRLRETKPIRRWGKGGHRPPYGRDTLRETKAICPRHKEKRLTASLRTGPGVRNKANFRIMETQSPVCIVI